MDFNFGDFIGQVVGQVGGGDGSDPVDNLASIAAKAIDDGAARVTTSASQQGSNPPVVAPTAYAAANAGSQKVLGIALSPNQLTMLKIGGGIVVVVVILKMMKRRK
jgi:hypothetical protein